MKTSLWEINDFHAVLAQKDRVLFVASFVVYIRQLLYNDEEHARRYPKGLLPWDAPSTKHSDIVKAINTKWKMLVLTASYDVQSGLPKNIVDTLSRLDGYRRELNELYEGSLWQQICNWRKREKIRDAVASCDFCVSLQDLFSAAIYVFVIENHWGRPSAFRHAVETVFK